MIVSWEDFRMINTEEIFINESTHKKYNNILNIKS